MRIEYLLFVVLTTVLSSGRSQHLLPSEDYASSWQEGGKLSLFEPFDLMQDLVQDNFCLWFLQEMLFNVIPKQLWALTMDLISPTQALPHDATVEVPDQVKAQGLKFQ